MAGIATTAPSGTAASPGQQQGDGPGQTGAGGEMGERARPPRRRKAAWHNEICPDVHTSRPSEAKTSTSVSPLV